MPILTSIMEHDLLGPAIREGFEQGFKEGLEEGRRGKFALDMLSRAMTRRFGPVPAPVAIRLADCSADRLDDLLLHMVDAKTIEDILQHLL